MKIVYGAQADALDIALKAGTVKKTVELAPEILLDLDAKGNPLSLEILGAREKLGKKNVQEFLLSTPTAVGR